VQLQRRRKSAFTTCTFSEHRANNFSTMPLVSDLPSIRFEGKGTAPSMPLQLQEQDEVIFTSN
jgi:hypothetical protein